MFYTYIFEILDKTSLIHKTKNYFSYLIGKNIKYETIKGK